MTQLSLGRFRLLEPNSHIRRIAFSASPYCAPPTWLLFNVEVNLCGGAVLGYLLAVQFHF
jgi:hypothetical protein